MERKDGFSLVKRKETVFYVTSLAISGAPLWLGVPSQGSPTQLIPPLTPHYTQLPGRNSRGHTVAQKVKERGTAERTTKDTLPPTQSMAMNNTLSMGTVKVLSKRMHPCAHSAQMHSHYTYIHFCL